MRAVRAAVVSCELDVCATFITWKTIRELIASSTLWATVHYTVRSLGNDPCSFACNAREGPGGMSYPPRPSVARDAYETSVSMNSSSITDRAPTDPSHLTINSAASRETLAATTPCHGRLNCHLFR